MAEFTITKWRCDRCGIIEDKCPKPHQPDMTVIVLSHWTDSLNNKIEWRDMCTACTKELLRAIFDDGVLCPYRDA